MISKCLYSQMGASPPAGGAGGDGGAGRAGTPGGGTPVGGSGARVQQEFRRTIPLSIDISGNTLGWPRRTSARTASRWDACTTSQSVRSGGTRPSVRPCPAFWLMVRETRRSGSRRENQSSRRSVRGSPFLQILPHGTGHSRSRRASAEHRTWTISRGSSPWRPRSHERVSWGQSLHVSAADFPAPTRSGAHRRTLAHVCTSLLGLFSVSFRGSVSSPSSSNFIFVISGARVEQQPSSSANVVDYISEPGGSKFV